MPQEIKVKVLKSFPDPRSNLMLKVDSTINVPLAQFWLKRLEEKDIEKVLPKLKAAHKDSKKGSK